MKQLKDYPIFHLNQAQKALIDSRNIFIGDIHNHCGISYGHGTLEKAINFAHQQLDFFSVTGHFAWPDMETTEGMRIPPAVVAYHKAGFSKLRKNWPEYLSKMQNAETPSFIPFPSWEFHSFFYGDYTVVAKEQGTILPKDPEEGKIDARLTSLIRDNNPKASMILAFPHHIGYKKGYRGINWDAFNEKTTPLVEIVSMHGCAESHDAPLRYLHTMGPRSEENTMQGGLKKGKHFGIIANTDHHNASPGSYGFGRTGVFVQSLSRDNIWYSLLTRKTLAYTGDPMRIALFADDREAIGSTVPSKKEISIDAYLVGFDSIDRFELVHEESVVASGTRISTGLTGGFVPIAFGWGEKNTPCCWDVEISTEEAHIVDAVPRLKGNDIVDPLELPVQDGEKENVLFQFETGIVSIHAVTDGNRTATTNDTQGVVIETDGRRGLIIIHIKAKWERDCFEKEYVYDINTLSSPKTEYIAGFVSPAIETGSFVSIGDAASEIHTKVVQKGAYYLRAYEKNMDGAYSSPFWIE